MTDELTGVLGILWESTVAFHARFGSKPTAYQAIARVLEEVGEVNTALVSGEHKAHVAEEIGDCFVTLFGAALAAGLNITDIVNGVLAVAAKNDAKTQATHYLREDGKITRIEGA